MLCQNQLRNCVILIKTCNSLQEIKRLPRNKVCWTTIRIKFVWSHSKELSRVGSEARGGAMGHLHLTNLNYYDRIKFFTCNLQKLKIKGLFGQKCPTAAFKQNFWLRHCHEWYWPDYRHVEELPNKKFVVFSFFHRLSNFRRHGIEN